MVFVLIVISILCATLGFIFAKIFFSNKCFVHIRYKINNEDDQEIASADFYYQVSNKIKYVVDAKKEAMAEWALTIGGYIPENLKEEVLCDIEDITVFRSGYNYIEVLEEYTTPQTL